MIGSAPTSSMLYESTSIGSWVSKDTPGAWYLVPGTYFIGYGGYIFHRFSTAPLLYFENYRSPTTTGVPELG